MDEAKQPDSSSAFALTDAELDDLYAVAGDHIRALIAELRRLREVEALVRAWGEARKVIDAKGEDEFTEADWGREHAAQSAVFALSQVLAKGDRADG